MLRGDDLVQVTLHEDDTVIAGLRQPRQEKRDDLDRLAARARQPGKVVVPVEPLDRLVLEIASRIAVVGTTDAVGQERHAPILEHVHQHRRAGSRETRHDDDGLAVAEPPRHALAESHRCRLCTIRPTIALTVIALLAVPTTAHAYIGPGAGFAVLSSFLVLFTTIVIAVASVLVWPL